MCVCVQRDTLELTIAALRATLNDHEETAKKQMGMRSLPLLLTRDKPTHASCSATILDARAAERAQAETRAARDADRIRVLEKVRRLQLTVTSPSVGNRNRVCVCVSMFRNLRPKQSLCSGSLATISSCATTHRYAIHAYI